MKKFPLLVLFAIGIMGFQACQSKQERINDLKEFVEEICEEGKDYTAEQWGKTNDRFIELLDNILSGEDLTEEERKEVAKLQGQYTATVFKNFGKAIMKQKGEDDAVLDSFFEGFDEELENQEQQTHP